MVWAFAPGSRRCVPLLARGGCEAVLPAQTMPDEDVELPKGFQINLDEADDTGPDLEKDSAVQKWQEMSLTHLLEEEIEELG